MVWGRSRGSPGRTRRAGMVLAAVLLMVMVTQTRGRSQLSIVEEIDKSLEGILQDVESLQRFLVTSTTLRETTSGGATTSEISSDASTEISVSTTDTSHATDVDLSSTDISNASPDTTATTIDTSTTPKTTSTDSSSSTSSTTDSTTSETTPTDPITVSTSPTTTSTTTTADSTTSSITATESTTSTTTTSTPTTTTIESTTSTTTTTTPTTTTTGITDPGNPFPKDRVKRRNLLSLTTPDDTLSDWVDPRIERLNDTTSPETSDVTSDVTSSEDTMPTSTATPAPVSDRLRLEAALNETHQVVTQVVAGTITEDQVRQIQAAEAEVKDVTDSPDEAFVEDLQNNPGLIVDAVELIKNDQDTLAAKIDKLKKHKTGVIVGSVLGGLLLVVLVVIGAVFYVRHRNKKKTGGRATPKKRSQSASASLQQQMVELGSNLDDFSPQDEFPPHSLMPPNPLIPRANLDNFSQSSAQRNNALESDRLPNHDQSMQVGEMRTEPGIENPGYVEEFPLRPVVPPKPRNRPTTFDKFGLAPNQMRIDQEPSGAHFEPSQQNHYIDELNNRMGPRERQVRPVDGIYLTPTEPSRRSSRNSSSRHRHHQHPRDHRIRPRNDHHGRRTPSVPPPDYTIPRDRHRSPDNFIAQKHHSQKQRPPRSPYEFADSRRTSAAPKPEAIRPRTIRNRSDIRRPYGPEDLY